MATSTVVATKIREYLAQNGIDADVVQGKVADLLTGDVEADLIVATTQVPDRVKVPVVGGVPFLTGMGTQKTLAEIEARLA